MTLESEDIFNVEDENFKNEKNLLDWYSAYDLRFLSEQTIDSGVFSKYFVMSQLFREERSYENVYEGTVKLFSSRELIDEEKARTPGFDCIEDNHTYIRIYFDQTITVNAFSGTGERVDPIELDHVYISFPEGQLLEFWKTLANKRVKVYLGTFRRPSGVLLPVGDIGVPQEDAIVLDSE